MLDIFLSSSYTFPHTNDNGEPVRQAERSVQRSTRIT